MIEVWNDSKCRKAFSLYLETVDFVRNINVKFGEKFLDTNKFPHDLSESLAARALINGEVCKRFNKLIDVCRHTHPDIIADDHRIAVKGTAKENGWVSYTEDDSTCEVIVWLDFYPLVFRKKNFLTTTCFYNPASYIPSDDINKNITYDKLSLMYELGDGKDLEIVESISFPGITEYNPDTVSFDEQQLDNMWNKWVKFENPA